jgi:hypothetical protein
MAFASCGSLVRARLIRPFDTAHEAIWQGVRGTPVPSSAGQTGVAKTGHISAFGWRRPASTKAFQFVQEMSAELSFSKCHHFHPALAALAAFTAEGVRLASQGPQGRFRP